MAATGFIERIKGKVISNKDCLMNAGTGGATFKGGGMLYVNSSSAGMGNTSDTSEDVLDSYSMPANTLSNNQYTLSITAFGQFAATASTSKIAKLYFGSGTSDSVAITGGSSASATPWMAQLTVFKTGANTQFVTSQQITGTTHGGITNQSVAAAETDTSAIVLKVTGKTNTAAANEVVLYGWYVECSNF